MTIHDYIKERGLTKWRTWPEPNSNKFTQAPIPAVLIDPDNSGPYTEFNHGDRFEIYANSDHTLFVSLNVTRGVFRIVHHDMLSVHSTWESMRAGLDYHLQ